MWARFVGVGLLFVGKLIMGIIMTFLCFITKKEEGFPLFFSYYFNQDILMN